VGLPAALEPWSANPGRAAVVVDFDGSLAPIVDDPAAAVALPAAAGAVSRLAGRLGLVAVVSGRPVAFLRERLADDRLAYAGVYGLERLVGGRVVVDERVAPFVDAVAAAARRAEADPALTGVGVERKCSVAAALHWRTCPERAEAAERFAAEEARRSGLEVRRGRMVAELAPPVAVDKGTAVDALLHDRAGELDAVLFAGDDLGDLAAFDALDRAVASGRIRHAVKVAVRSAEEPAELVARAGIEVDGPSGLAALLSELADAVGRAPGGG